MEIGKRKYYLFFKRVCDVVLAAILLALLAPVFPVIAVIIKLTSTGPVFYCQMRVGLNGRNFKIMKFRTMFCDAEQITGPVWSSINDPRVTSVGRLLRDTGLDELPYLFNILIGDMSFVGPRPLDIYFYEKLSDEFKKRCMVHPGFAGLWQVYGRDLPSSSLKSMINMDMKYIKEMSLLLDVKLLSLTIVRIITGKNAAY